MNNSGTRFSEIGGPTGRVALGLLFTGAVVLICASGCEKAGASKSSAPAPAVVKTKGGIEMVQLLAGSFLMGSDHGSPDESPRHRVTVDPLVIDRYEVTQEEYEKFVIGNPSKFKDRKNPVERVRWVEAALYCNARSSDEKLEPCYDEKTFVCNFRANGYRLPTEAEWEYVCRAGTDEEYSFGGNPSRLGDYAWFRDNSGERTHPVGTKRPNPWGLFDLYGNVGEWCQDVYDAKFYQTSSEETPCCAAGGSRRILRGGSYSAGADHCRSAGRAGEAPGNFADACFSRPDIGFRCVRRATAAAAEKVASAH
jgi:formylglycine-generating enzyme required for sulfatase activity